MLLYHKFKSLVEYLEKMMTFLDGIKIHKDPNNKGTEVCCMFGLGLAYSIGTISNLLAFKELILAKCLSFVLQYFSLPILL